MTQLQRQSKQRDKQSRSRILRKIDKLSLVISCQICAWTLITNKSSFVWNTRRATTSEVEMKWRLKTISVVNIKCPSVGKVGGDHQTKTWVQQGVQCHSSAPPKLALNTAINRVAAPVAHKYTTFWQFHTIFPDVEETNLNQNQHSWTFSGPHQ